MPNSLMINFSSLLTLSSIDSISVLRKYYEIDKNQMFQDEVEDIRLMLERDLSWVVGGLSGRIESSFDDDPAILKAIEVLSDQYVYGSTLDPSMN